MKKLLMASLMFFNLGCATLSPKDDDSTIISIPRVNKEVEILNLKQAKENKIKIGEKNGLVFEFYPGPRGSYYVVAYPKSKTKEASVSLKLFDVFLEVDKNGKSPETLMLASEYDMLYSGFGMVRSGKTHYQLKFIPQDSSFGKSFSIDFIATLK